MAVCLFGFVNISVTEWRDKWSALVFSGASEISYFTFEDSSFPFHSSCYSQVAMTHPFLILFRYKIFKTLIMAGVVPYRWKAMVGFDLNTHHLCLEILVDHGNVLVLTKLPPLCPGSVP